jgi:hypothetical protein
MFGSDIENLRGCGYGDCHHIQQYFSHIVAVILLDAKSAWINM